jgi:hypothetical protein
MQVTLRRCRGTCGGFKKQNFQPSQMYRLVLLCTSAVLFSQRIHKYCTSAAQECNVAQQHIFYKATFTVYSVILVQDLSERPLLSTSPAGQAKVNCRTACTLFCSICSECTFFVQYPIVFLPRLNCSQGYLGGPLLPYISFRNN